MTSRALLTRRPCFTPVKRWSSTFPNDAPKPWPKTTRMPVHFRERDKHVVDRDSPKGSRILTFKARNGLTTMSHRELRSVNQHVRMWDENFMVQMSVVQGPGSDFCSGLNLQDIRGRPLEVRYTLEALSRLVSSMRACRAPLLSVINGPSYGSAGHALASGRYRVCTEKSMFCIPEATLGLGLAGGLSYALPRLDSGNRALGLCLGLTGMALQGADLLTAQLASQYFTYAHLAALVERITDAQSMPRSPFADVDKNEPTGAGRAAVLQMIEDACNLSYNVDGVTANDFAFKGKDGKPITHRTPLDKILPEVERVFTVDSVEEVLDNLSGSKAPWAQVALKNMGRSSPLSLRTIFEQIKRGATKSMEECLDDEFSVNMHLFEMDDFESAMHAHDNAKAIPPTWSASGVENVTADEVAVLFEPTTYIRQR